MMKKAKSSRLTKALLETAEDMRNTGIMDEATHREVTLRHPGAAPAHAQLLADIDTAEASLARGGEEIVMSMELQLSPEVRAALLAQAQANGLSLEAYAEKVLREHVFADSPLKGLELKCEQAADMVRAAVRAEAWRESARGLPSTPPLSDEAISRESIYGDHG